MTSSSPTTVVAQAGAVAAVAETAAVTVVGVHDVVDLLDLGGQLLELLVDVFV